VDRLKREVERLLREMGNTANEVAAKLTKHQVKGVRNAARFLNPVVRYLQVRVQSESVSFDVMKGDMVCIGLPMDRHGEVPIPEPVWTFLFEFNRGKYPALELSERETQS
jgi:hypothetical protein